MNTTKIALLLHTAIAAQLMLASATSHFVVNLNWPVVQKVTSELLSRLTNAVQLLDVSNAHQKQQHQRSLTLLQLVHHHQIQLPSQPQLPQSSSLRLSLVVLVTPRAVKLSSTVKSGLSLNVKHVVVQLNSLSNAARLNALLQLLVQLAKLSLVLTLSIAAATLSTAHQKNIVTNANWSSVQM